jgi:hypothetical protein
LATSDIDRRHLSRGPFDGSAGAEVERCHQLTFGDGEEGVGVHHLGFAFGQAGATPGGVGARGIKPGEVRHHAAGGGKVGFGMGGFGPGA